EHIHIGRAFRRLTHENLLVIGSGFSFHNMKAFFSSETSESKTQNEAFEHWLADTCTSQQIDEEERTKRLVHWSSAPSARYCHPREEHLLPLHVCYGVAGSYCSERFDLRILNKKTSMYLWEPKS
ncbi:MAG TPA: class III extradiol ring-cleavage dioxygenase, partial [Nitrospiria bacterium]